VRLAVFGTGRETKVPRPWDLRPWKAVRPPRRLNTGLRDEAREPDHRIEKELKKLRRDSAEGLRGRTGIAGIGDLHYLIRVIPAQGNRLAGLFVA
jgi:hypothetical protein